MASPFEKPLETVSYDLGEDHVATITLRRPDVLNAANQKMCNEISAIWDHVRHDGAVHAVVLRAEGARAFSTGVDVREGLDFDENTWSQDDPGVFLCPKQRGVWKPVVCAVQGMAAGGAFYLIAESDIIICSEDATFFDPHVTFGWTAALEPVALTYRMPLGEVLRMALMGNDERLSAERALSVGLVSEVVANDGLWQRAHEIAAAIAAKPPAAVQGTVRAIWESLDFGRAQALRLGYYYTQIGNPIGTSQLDPDQPRSKNWHLR